MSVLEASQEGRLRALEATRDALAAAIDAGGGTIAQNVAQFRAVLAEIDELSASGSSKVVTPLDEFTRRLAERESATKGSRRSATN